MPRRPCSILCLTLPKRASPPRPPTPPRKELRVNEYPFAERDGCGLTLDDWASFLGLTPDTFTGPALLWWALAGGKQGVNLMHPNPFPDLLTSMASDTHALATLATSSQQNEVRALAPARR